MIFSYLQLEHNTLKCSLYLGDPTQLTLEHLAIWVFPVPS